jgi:hypothetical protein
MGHPIVDPGPIREIEQVEIEVRLAIEQGQARLFQADVVVRI